MRYSKEDIERGRERLAETLQPGDTVHTILKHVSRSGMLREIDVRKLDCSDGTPEALWLSWSVSRLLGESLGSNDGVRVSGAGMDMGFALVYDIGRKLWPDGFDCIGEGCPANDHSNDRGTPDYSPTRRHKDGGYALRHRWM